MSQNWRIFIVLYYLLMIIMIFFYVITYKKIFAQYKYNLSFCITQISDKLNFYKI